MKKLYPFILCLLLCFTSCSNDDASSATEPISEPTIELLATQANVNITYTSIQIQGRLVDSDQSNVSEKGVCWSTQSQPTIDDFKSVESNDNFTSEITDLIANTIYYYRVYATNSLGTFYSEELSFRTLSLDNTNWNFTTIYGAPNNYTLYSEVNFYDDGTTKFDELDLPGQAPGAYITYGTWSLDGNTVTYVWDSSDPSNPTYIYTGILQGMEMNGTYTHTSLNDGTFSAIKI